MKSCKTLIIALVIILVSCGISYAQSPAKHGKVISVAKFENMASKSGDRVIIDVRTPEELAAGKIKGAINLDYNQENFRNQLEQLDKNKTYMVYCKVGVRAGKAAEIMKDAGFKKVYLLEGGLEAWKAHDKPIEK